VVIHLVLTNGRTNAVVIHLVLINGRTMVAILGMETEASQVGKLETAHGTVVSCAHVQVGRVLIGGVEESCFMVGDSGGGTVVVKVIATARKDPKKGITART
jgi:hypothetical protein